MVCKGVRPQASNRALEGSNKVRIFGFVIPTIIQTAWVLCYWLKMPIAESTPSLSKTLRPSPPIRENKQMPMVLPAWQHVLAVYRGSHVKGSEVGLARHQAAIPNPASNSLNYSGYAFPRS